jgi:predicted MPP superfamily phosphohydrolase
MTLRKFLTSPLGKLFISAIGLSLYYLVFIYPLNSLFNNLGFSLLEELFNNTLTILDLLISAAFLTPLLGRLCYQLFHSVCSRHFMAICMTWAGFGFFLFFPTLALDFLNIFIKFPPTALYWITLSLLCICILIGIAGIINANLIFVKSLTIQDPRITNASTAIQLSDVHIGSRSSFFIKNLVRQVNKLNADRVFITGDLVDLSSVNESDLAILKTIDAPVYFVTGNHDRYVSLERLLPLLKKQDFIILRNETIELPEYDLTGIDDAENPKQVERVINTMDLNKQRFNILLYHRPQGFDVAAEKGIDLMLSGHTHNGQIIPFNFLVKKIFKDIKGEISRNKSTLYVSTGTSTWGPIMRIGSVNEITWISLKP